MEIKELFDVDRFPSGLSLLFLILYFPVGLLVLCIRLFIAFQALVLAVLFPQISLVRGYVFNSLAFALGIIIKKDRQESYSRNAKILVSNHVTVCDWVAVRIATDAFGINTLFSKNISRAFDLQEVPKTGSQEEKSSILRRIIVTSRNKLLLHPEGTTTNGRVGLLKFDSWQFLPDVVIQPVSIRVSRPWFAQISTSVIPCNYLSDILWFFFVPYTSYNIRYLNVLSGIYPEQLADLAQRTIAQDLHIQVTTFTDNDKAEYSKRLLAEQNQPSSPHFNQQQLERMVNQVAEVLPHVSRNTIRTDLVRTRSVDITISNILEGNVQFVPQTSLPETGAVPSTSYASQTTFHENSAPSFSRSAQDRMNSFHDRKAKLIENARKKYIEKHGLKIVGLNC